MIAQNAFALINADFDVQILDGLDAKLMRDFDVMIDVVHAIEKFDQGPFVPLPDEEAVVEVALIKLEVWCQLWIFEEI